MKLLKISFWALLFGLLLSASAAEAQTRFKSRYLKSVDDARRQAITGTLIPIATGIATASLIESNTVEKTASFLAVYGLVLGPSLGNFYAKDYLRGMLGVAARLGGGYMLVDATRELAGKDVADGLGWDHKEVSLTDTKILIGSGIILGSAVYNIISAKASVHRFNDKQGYIVGVVPGFKEGKIFPMLTASVRF